MLKHITGLPGVYPLPGKHRVGHGETPVVKGDAVTISGVQENLPVKPVFVSSLSEGSGVQGKKNSDTLIEGSIATTASFAAATAPGPAGFVAGTADLWLQDDCRNNGKDLVNFRLCTDPFPEAPGHHPSRVGLDELNISGSSQFTRQGLAEMRERIPGKNIIMLDLREESHFYGDDRVYSWRNHQNNVNKGVTPEELHKKEAEVLEALTRNDGTATLRPRKAITEEELCRESGIGYMRIPVTDHLKPEDRDVDQFVDFVRTMPKDAWLNFHCKAGMGRTTTFMAMYDMMHNAGRVSANDIGRRQFLLGGVDLLGDKPARDEYRKIAGEQRKNFAHQFYQYCLENKESNFAVNWSEWKAATKHRYS